MRRDVNRPNRLAMTVVVCLLVAFAACTAGLGLAACNAPDQGEPGAQGSGPAPAATAKDDGAGDAAGGHVVGSGLLSDFLDNDAGLFPDTFFNKTMLNYGKRGCNSCHDNLFDTWDLLDAPHIIADVGYEAKKGRITDCLACHRIHSDRTGVSLGDVIHASHYSNEVFVEQDHGNCWSCHATTSLGASGTGMMDNPGEYQWLLWDEVKYDAIVGGYPDAVENEAERIFIQNRGYFGSSGFITSVSAAGTDSVKAELAQVPTPEEDVFVVNNFGPEPQRIEGDEWRLVVEGGVANPREFTLADLQAMPQHDMMAGILCGTSGIGSPYFGNVPARGVLMADIIEACGGLTDGTNMLYMTSDDTWSMPFCTEDILGLGTMVALQMYGHDLTPDQGYPATVIIPGAPGASWVKWVVNLTFSADEMAFNPFKMDVTSDQKQHLAFVNSAWLANDGAMYKVGEPVKLEGWTFATSAAVGHTAQVKFSTDMGLTWKTYEVPDSFDPYQLVNWTFEWTPPETGVYVLKASGTASDGYEQMYPDSVIVLVTE